MVPCIVRPLALIGLVVAMFNLVVVAGMMPAVEVRCRVAGSRPGEPGLPQLLLTLERQRLTVAELIRRAVEEQVREMTAARRLSIEQQRQAFDRQYLTDNDVRGQAAAGAVRLQSSVREQRPLDPVAAVRTALDSFERGGYAVLVDGHQAERLDEVLELRLGSRVIFLRLTPLVGG